MLLALGGNPAALPLLSIALPIGLSFHTFQAMSYTIEVYRGNQQPERHFGIYALYVMFYPQLVAGPIERPQNLLHQFREVHRFRYDEVTGGLRLMAWGFFKKLVVADRMAIGVDTVYAAPQHFSGGQVIIATVLFAFQLYADFSGYSDIARGSARVMGFRLVKNFDCPYAAKNIAEFWRRWHISLYSWFNDYLYSPMALAWRDWGKAAVVAAILVTFTISGLWHGAAWTFVIWGALHGIAVTAETLTRRWRGKYAFLPTVVGVPLSVAATFAFVCFTFIFFRARSVADAWYIVAHLTSGIGELWQNAMRPTDTSLMLGAMGFYREDTRTIPLAVATMLTAEYLQSRIGLEQKVYSVPRYVRWTAYYAIVAATIFFGANNAVQPFIYFQF
jgi:D-alanyl-lipoteichoic acid acyltransferase DltB (MBOAT superfamily)